MLEGVFWGLFSAGKIAKNNIEEYVLIEHNEFFMPFITKLHFLEYDFAGWGLPQVIILYFVSAYY